MDYIVVNIGCIECGVPSKIVGVFETEKEAKKIADILDIKANWRYGGENHFNVYPIKKGYWLDDEYLKIIENGESDDQTKS